jgi:DNA-binding transcriptional LysR family regulator
MTGQLERIEVFVAVAEHQSFAGGARALGVSRSIATRYVGELESLLGAQLLVRTTRRVSLTLAGRLYLDQVKSLAGAVARANGMIREQQSALSGVLRVSAPLSLGLRFMPRVVAQFRSLYPNVRLNLNLTDRFVDILSAEFGMALRISSPPRDKSTIWRRICNVPRLFVAAPAYLLRMGTPQDPTELTQHHCLGYSRLAGGDHWHLHHTAGREHTIAPNLVFQCDNGDVIGDLAALGEGIALLPRFIIASHLSRGTLQPILTDWSAPEIWLSAYYPPYEALPPKVALFTRCVEELVTNDPGMLGVRPPARGTERASNPGKPV